MARTIFEGRHVLVLERDGWEYVERIRGKSAVAVVAVTDDGKLVLIEQLRSPVNGRVIDLPAGLVGDDGVDDAAASAHKELEEETGHVCDSAELIFSSPTSPGITSEMVSFYRARGVRRTGMGGGVGSEEITVHLVRLTEIHEWLEGKAAEGILIDLKLRVALALLPESRVAHDAQ